MKKTINVFVWWERPMTINNTETEKKRRNLLILMLPIILENPNRWLRLTNGEEGGGKRKKKWTKMEENTDILYFTIYKTYIYVYFISHACYINKYHVMCSWHSCAHMYIMCLCISTLMSIYICSNIYMPQHFSLYGTVGGVMKMETTEGEGEEEGGNDRYYSMCVLIIISQLVTDNQLLWGRALFKGKKTRRWY